MDPSDTALVPSLHDALWIVADGLLMLAVVILVVRLTGLRAFAKMSSFDFAVTVATGSVLASILLDPSKSFVHGLLVVAALFLAQVIVALGRLASARFQALVDNEPLLLMDGPTRLHDNMRAGRISDDDLTAKLREAGVMDPGTVKAVVLETTGDISILSGDGALDPSLLDGVRR